MKSRFSGTVTATLLNLCALVALPGCALFDVNKMTEKMVQESWKREGEKARQSLEAQQQKQRAQQPSQSEQDRQTLALQTPIKVGEEITGQFASAQLEGNWKGNACNQQMTIAIKVTTRWDKGLNFGSNAKTVDVRGVFRATTQTQQENVRILETGLEGKFERKAGFLTMTSIPKPPTEEELRLRAQKVAEIDQLKMKLGILAGRGHLQEYHATEERINILAVTYNQRVREQSAAAEAALVSFKLDMARNMDGSGWAGIMEGADFDGCEIALVSEGGIRTDKLPSVTGQVALERAHHHYYTKPSPLQVYWLDMASKDAKEEDFFDFGVYYDRQGERSPAYYSRASHYYQILVERNGDARAQGQLARLYESGLGIPKNLEKAQQLYRLAGETRKKALNICTSAPIKNFADRVMKRSQQTGKGAEVLMGIVTGIRVDAMNLRLIAIEPEDVASVDKPFVCTFISKRIDPKVDAELVPDGHYFEGPYGEVRYVDNSLDKAGKMAVASFVQEMAKAVPVISRFRIIPFGNLRYQIVWDSSTRETVELN